MKRFLGATHIFAAAPAAMLALAMLPAAAQVTQVTQAVGQDPSPLLWHAGGSSQGYLGVELADVDQDKAQSLRLKEVRGAVITLIDHDAPAGQARLQVNDVIVQMNGQAIEGAEQLRRMLRETPPGRKVSLAISRDGNVQTMTIELADRRKIEQNAWNNIGNNGDVFPPSGGLGILSGSGDAPLPPGFHMPFVGSTSLNVGAMVEPLAPQTADYLGLTSGIMIKQVAHKSEAEKAGLKAKDVILKVGTEPITNLAGWDRALRSNQGKPVQVTILRDRRQQTVILQVDSKRHGELIWDNPLSAGDALQMALADSDSLSPFCPGNDAAAKALRDQAEALKGKIRGFVDGQVSGQIDAEQAEQLRKQAEALRDKLLRDNINDQWKVDPRQMEELKRQMDEFQKNFKPEDFKLDEKRLEDWKQQLDQLKNQLNEWKLAWDDPA